MRSVTIGILGGMGPRATVLFQEKLLTKFSGTDQVLPRIICSNNGSIPDRTRFLLEAGADPLYALMQEAEILQEAQVDIVCMPCNTAHSPKILARLMASVPLPIIDMPAACVLQAEKLSSQKLLILGTRGNKVAQVFDSRTNIPCLYPDTSGQKMVDTLINAAKSGAAPAEDTLAAVLDLITRSEADTVVLGCTELSLLTNIIPAEKRSIDSMDVLAETCNQICMKYTERKEIL